MGPCALEYTKLKTSDHLWTDPSANELVQRHRIHGAHRSQDTTASRRPALGVSLEADLDQLSPHKVLLFGHGGSLRMCGTGVALIFVLLSLVLKTFFAILDPQEAVQWQHVRGQVCCISERVC